MDLTVVPIRVMEYESEVEIPKEMYQNTDILDMKDVFLKFQIYKDMNQDDILILESTGTMYLEDARSLESVPLTFHIKMEEKIDESSEMCGRFLTNSQNTLDIMSILWENIVLEIPISYTVCEPLKSEEKKTYKIVGEESVNKIDPRLAPLMELLDKEKE